MGTLRKVSPLLGESVAIERLRDFVVGVSLIGGPVLLSGGVGTGKDLSARKIHAVGRTARAPYIRVSCRRFRESELEFLLFGNNDKHGCGGLLGSRSGSTCQISSAEHQSTCFSPVSGQNSAKKLRPQGRGPELRSTRSLLEERHSRKECLAAGAVAAP